MLKQLEAEIEGAAEFADVELPNPLDPGALALGGNWGAAHALGAVCADLERLSQARGQEP